MNMGMASSSCGHTESARAAGPLRPPGPPPHLLPRVGMEAVPVARHRVAALPGVRHAATGLSAPPLPASSRPPSGARPAPLPASRRHFARCGVRGFPWAVCGDRDGAANGCPPPPSVQSRGGAALRDAAGGLPSCALFRPKRPYDEPQGQPRGECGLTRRVPAPQHSC